MSDDRTCNQSLQVAERLRAACTGHPSARIPWPHRLLHDAAEEIDRLTLKLDRGFQMLEAYGVPRERAGELANGIDVLATRYNKQRRESDAALSDLLSRLDAFRCALESIKLEAGSHTIPRDAGNENPFVRIWNLANDGLVAVSTDEEERGPSCRHPTTRFDTNGQFRCAACDAPLIDPRVSEEHGSKP